MKNIALAVPLVLLLCLGLYVMTSEVEGVEVSTPLPGASPRANLPPEEGQPKLELVSPAALEPPEPEPEPKPDPERPSKSAGKPALDATPTPPPAPDAADLAASNVAALQGQIDELERLIDVRIKELFEAKYAAGQYERVVTNEGEEVPMPQPDHQGNLPAIDTRTEILGDGRVQTDIVTVVIADYADLAALSQDRDSLKAELASVPR